jgi:predicted alpha/beta-fold hydrolase
VVSAVASVCAPLDLAAGGEAIGRGFNRLVYTTHVPAHHEAQGAGQAGAAPGPVRPRAAAGARDLYDFDNVFTAPLHGFRDTTTTGRAARPSRTWRRSACRRWW